MNHLITGIYNLAVLCIFTYAVFVLGHSVWWLLFMGLIFASNSSEGKEK